MNEALQNKNYLDFIKALFELEGRMIIIDGIGETTLVDTCRKAAEVSLPRLLPRYSQAVRTYYGLEGEPKTYREVGVDLSITVERVRQIVLKALRQLRDSTEFDQLALALSESGYTNKYILTLSVRARHKPAVDAILERVRTAEKTGPEIRFLIDHKPGCGANNPCPTCQARTLFAEHGITVEMNEILQEWQNELAPDILDLPINTVLPGMSVRTTNCLKNDNIVTLRDLMEKTEAELLRTPNFGWKSLIELKERLLPLGLEFDMRH
jgi:hypothetical protein